MIATIVTLKTARSVLQFESLPTMAGQEGKPQRKVLAQGQAPWGTRGAEGSDTPRPRKAVGEDEEEKEGRQREIRICKNHHERVGGNAQERRKGLSQSVRVQYLGHASATW